MPEISLILSIEVLMISRKFMFICVEHEKEFNNLGAWLQRKQKTHYSHITDQTMAPRERETRTQTNKDT